MTIEEPEKKELQDRLQSISKDMQKAIENTSEAAKDIKASKDIVDATSPLIQGVDKSELEGLSDWAFELGEHTAYLVAESEDLVSDSDNLTSSASGIALRITSIIIPPVWVGEAPDNVEWQNFSQTVTMDEQFDRVRGYLVKFGLDESPSGKVSALNHFNASVNAFRLQVTKENPAITSLIPMREAIDTTLEQLWWRLPKQSKIPRIGDRTKAKIVGIGNQTSSIEYNEVKFEELGEDCSSIRENDLTASKDKPISQREWKARLIRATLWFQSFLAALDPEEFRS